jgi:hypothetical protein
MKALGVAFAMLLMFCAGISSADIINGDFTSFTGGLPDNWIANVSGGGVPGEKDTSSPDGSSWNFVPFGRIEQGNVTPVLVEGQTYRVSFLASSPQPSFPAADLNVRMFDNTTFEFLGGLDITSGLTTTWSSHSFEFTASSSVAGHLMYPYIVTGSGVTGIDNIHVEAVPEPAAIGTCSCGLAGLTFKLWRRKRQRKAT